MPTQVLCNLYAKTVAVLQRLPKEAAYRRHTEQIVQQRLQIVQSVGERTPVRVLRAIIIYCA